MKETKTFPNPTDEQIQSIVKAICDGDLCAREIAAGQKPYRAKFSIKSMEKLKADAKEAKE
jgi:hypothetical protein